jgi:hypothetical protein
MEKYDGQLDVVFKKCKSQYTGHDCLVIGIKPCNRFFDDEPFQFLCNESRQNIGNKNFAKFRCNGLIILEIYDLVTLETLSFINHTCTLTYDWLPSRNVSIKYTVGDFVQPDDYDENIEGICRPGLHYFLSREGALNYENGCSKGYDSNGFFIPQVECNFYPYPIIVPLPKSPIRPPRESPIGMGRWRLSKNQRTGGRKMVLASKLKSRKDYSNVPKKSRFIRHFQPAPRLNK